MPIFGVMVRVLVRGRGQRRVHGGQGHAKVASVADDSVAEFMSMAKGTSAADETVAEAMSTVDEAVAKVTSGGSSAPRPRGGLRHCPVTLSGVAGAGRGGIGRKQGRSLSPCV